METIATTIDFSALAAELIRTAHDLNTSQTTLETAGKNLAYNKHVFSGKLSAYQEAFVRLCVATLAQKHLTWCTRCKTIITKGEAMLMFVESTSITDAPSGCYWRLEEHQQLCRLCSACHSEYRQQHGWTQKESMILEDKQSYFYVFLVEQRIDGLYAGNHQENIPRRLDPERYPLPTRPPPEVMRSLAFQCELPAHLEMASGELMVFKK